MAGLKFEGDLAEINERQLDYIKSVLEKRGYTNNKVVIEPVGKAGDNYVANVKRITVEDDKVGNFKIVAKVAPSHEMMRMMTNTEHMFRNEHIMYTKVLPKFTQLEIASDIPEEERFRYAACYGSSNDAPNEVILLEDLKESDYTMLDRLRGISPECVKSVLKNFGILHSLSFALKYKEPEVYEEFKSGLFDAWSAMGQTPEVTLYFQQVENNACKIVDSDIHKKALSGAILGCLKEIGKLAKYDKNGKHSIIQQGDAWTNNIMFKFDGETLLGSIMIDYQGSKPTNPVADLLYMISNCTDYQSRKEHFHDWIDYYHSELDKSLSNYGLKANFVYPRDQLYADLKRYGKFSFGLSVLLAGILSANSEEASEMKKSLEKGDPTELLKDENLAMPKNLETIALLKTRLEGLVDSYHELGLM